MLVKCVCFANEGVYPQTYSNTGSLHCNMCEHFEPYQCHTIILKHTVT